MRRPKYTHHSLQSDAKDMRQLPLDSRLLSAGETISLCTCFESALIHSSRHPYLEPTLWRSVSWVHATGIVCAFTVVLSHPTSSILHTYILAIHRIYIQGI